MRGFEPSRATRLRVAGIALAAAGSLVAASGSAAASPIRYDQYDSAASLAVSSQNFLTSLDTFDSQAADDFVVPRGQRWAVDQVEVAGRYFNGAGPASSVNVYIYANAGGRPGTMLFGKTVWPSWGRSTGDFGLAVDPAPKLGPGTYWLSVQANLDLTRAGQWGWTLRGATSYNRSTWRNPGGGFATACGGWAARAVCGAAGDGPDLVFRIRARRL